MLWHLMQNTVIKMENEFLQKEVAVVEALKTVFDPEIPVNIYDLGLIYDIEVQESTINIEMTLTAPGCPAVDFIMDEINEKVQALDGVDTVNINLVFDPPWDKEMMSEEAMLELGFL